MESNATRMRWFRQALCDVAAQKRIETSELGLDRERRTRIGAPII
jgi:hypothetical protein